MLISNLCPVVAPYMPDGSVLIACSDLEVADGITADQSLVKSGPNGSDLIWSTKGQGGLTVRNSAQPRSKIAGLSRAGLADLTATRRGG